MSWDVRPSAETWSMMRSIISCGSSMLSAQVKDDLEQDVESKRSRHACQTK